MTNHNFPDEEVGDPARHDEEAGDPPENRNLENCCLNCSPLLVYFFWAGAFRVRYLSFLKATFHFCRVPKFEILVYSGGRNPIHSLPGF
jgi:hypothetical protein